MPDQFVGEIRMIAFNFAPSDWAFCDGQLLQIADHEALFELIGTTYGGDGTTTFALPDLRGRVALHAGQGPGLDNYDLAEKGGEEKHTLVVNEMPSHNHTLNGINGDAESTKVKENLCATTSENVYAPGGQIVGMNAQGISPRGGGQPHNNIQPYLALRFIIALQGIFPTQP